MRVRTGTSGFSYPAWTGPFYPAGTKRPDMLSFYASRLGSVEINNTFYRMPKADLLERWRDTVPDTFRFALKASRRITHQQRLKDAGDSVNYLFRTAEVLGERLGPFLFQLPPYLRCDIDQLASFLGLLPDGMRAAFEFRHASWFDDEVFALLAGAGASLCIADSGSDHDAPLVATADFGYLRLRREDYDETALRAWADRIRRQPWRETYVFFKHEDEGAGPRMAAQFEALLVES
ncbi:MAG: DUF72 domain-containing protein [Holophagales bacterium]|nr:DUF72 domain-containing protein [Holophagales bacterium]MYH25901.1 DUF72 domain-containing protein [Holophagales bacterium]